MRSETARPLNGVPRATPVEDTIPMHNALVPSTRPPVVPMLDVGGTTDCGGVPESNEDQFAIIELQRHLRGCVDGLTDEVDDETIASIVERAPSASTASKELVARPSMGGGGDNTTEVVAQITAEVPA